MKRKTKAYKRHIELIKTWFYSDLDIQFCLKRDNELALCEFESNVYYEHLNRNGSTYKSTRHKGDKRRFIVIDCSDSFFESLKSWCYTEYDLEECLSVLEDFRYNDIAIVNAENWKE